MKNKEIINVLKKTVAFMELHNESDFIIKRYTNAIYNLERTNYKLEKLSIEALKNIEGVGENIAISIYEINEKRSYSKLDKLKLDTPIGLIELMKVRGLTPKKLKTIWHEMKIDNEEKLKKAISDNSLKKLKGFGDKTIQQINENLIFAEQTKGWIYYSIAEKLANTLKAEIESVLEGVKINFAGKLRRKWDIINQLEMVIGYKDLSKLNHTLSTIPNLKKEPSKSGPFTWRGSLIDPAPVEVVFYLTPIENYCTTLFIKTGSQTHINHVWNGISLKKIAYTKPFETEEKIYEALGLSYCPPEIREGNWELEAIQKKALPELVTYNDLKGILHTHTVYSDGENTIEEMAIQCKKMGFSYLGISDHSKSTSFYANGMFEETVKKQHIEIDILNKQLAPFKIFKGVEADILSDGSLDYDNETLATFDFVVASIHSNLNMEIDEATNRLLLAIKNPYTTILGHMTGRLLLMRKGYPVDHKKIIAACVEHKVIIEINAHPKRLDMDWRWIHYALEKGALLSINPDAHSTDGFKDMYYGACVGRKGGLSKEKTFNAWGVEKVKSYFKNK